MTASGLGFGAGGLVGTPADITRLRSLRRHRPEGCSHFLKAPVLFGNLLLQPLKVWKLAFAQLRNRRHIEILAHLHAKELLRRHALCFGRGFQIALLFSAQRHHELVRRLVRFGIRRPTTLDVTNAGNKPLGFDAQGRSKPSQREAPRRGPPSLIATDLGRRHIGRLTKISLRPSPHEAGLGQPVAKGLRVHRMKEYKKVLANSSNSTRLQVPTKYCLKLIRTIL